MLTLQNTKRKNNSLLLTEKNNTAALIGINLYSILFVYLFIQFLECSAPKYAIPENKALFVLFVMCIFVLIFNNKDTIMTKIFNLERICLYNREIILAALLRHNSKINMTKNREIVIFQKKKVI